MSSAASAARQRWLVYLALALVAVASAYFRAPGLGSAGFASHDVAGITYNAQLLLHGDLPYRDSVELKAPGSFYLAAAVAPPGRGIAWVQRLHLLANLWGLGTLLVVAAITWRLFGGRAAVVAASLYALHDAHLDSMDANYVTWANLPAAIAGALGLEARGTRLCDPVGRRRLWLWFAAGVFAGLAALFKRPAAAVGPALLLMALWPRPGEQESLGARIRGAAMLAAGVAAAHLPIAMHFAAKGALGDFVHGYGLNTWGAAYISSREVGLVNASREGLLASAHFVGLPLALAAFATLAPVRGLEASAAVQVETRTRDIAGSLAVWAAFMLAATAIGFRFYKGYFSTALAPLCVLAAAPWGAAAYVAGLPRRTTTWPQRAAGFALLALVGVAGARQLDINAATRADRARPHDAGSRAIVRMIRPTLLPGDRVWVWGWHLWDVYTYADVLSGSRIYKSLGQLTPPNDDTWRSPPTPLRFVDGPRAELLLEELRVSRPKWIVLGSSVPVREFDELNAWLRLEYRRDRTKRLGRVQFWLRREP